MSLLIPDQNCHKYFQREMEKHGHTVEYRTINSVVDGDALVSKNLLKQKAIVAEMKELTKGILTCCMS